MSALSTSLTIAAGSMQVSTLGIQTAGSNLSNVANPTYSRERLNLAASSGGGATIVDISGLRDKIVDSQVVREGGNLAYIEGMQGALQLAQVGLGQQIDRQSATPEAGAAAQNLGGQMAIANGLSEFFNSVQSASLSPSSVGDRQVLLMKASQLTDKINAVDGRLATMQADLGTDILVKVADANSLIKSAASTATAAMAAQQSGSGSAAVLNDAAQNRLASLGKLIGFTVSHDDLNRITVTVGGIKLVDSGDAAGNLQVVQDANGNPTIQAVSADGKTVAPLDSRGELMGIIDARDGAIQTLRSQLNTLSKSLITQVNAVHSSGMGLDGTSGESFFTGTGAGNIGVNKTLSDDVRKIQLSSDGTSGNNETALALASLAAQPVKELGNLTFSQHYNQTVAQFGQVLSGVNNRQADQAVLTAALEKQRDSISGVSQDEEMASLITYQRAFQASAKVISMVDEIMKTIIDL